MLECLWMTRKGAWSTCKFGFGKTKFGGKPFINNWLSKDLELIAQSKGLDDMKPLESSSLGVQRNPFGTKIWR